MVASEDVIKLYQLLKINQFHVLLTGGWGVDDLLGLRACPHHNLDVLMLVDDVTSLLELLRQEGYTYEDLWSENLWTVDAHRNRIDSAFFLRDAGGREFDAHALRLDEHGNGVPAWEMPEEFIYAPQYFSGKEMVAGCPVRCMSAEYQMVAHTGYGLPNKQVPDLIRLYEKFGVEYPKEISLYILHK
jgi:hypothetical protein